MAHPSRDQNFLKSVKGKVIIGFLVGIIALAASYLISRAAFGEFENLIAQIATPDEKLRLVNETFSDILQLNQLQSEIQSKNGRNGAEQAIQKNYVEHAQVLKNRLDSLAIWFAGNPRQLSRLDTIRQILDVRSEAFQAYILERKGFADNLHLKRRVSSISEILETSADLRGDCTVVRTEQQTTSTVVRSPQDSTNALNAPKGDNQKKGLFARIFKGKKNTEPVTTAKRETETIKEKEITVLIDTITIAKKDSAFKVVGKEVRDMAHNQIVMANRFLERERQLQLGEIMLMGQLMEVMREVETDVLNDMYRENVRAKQTIGKSIKDIGLIFIIVLTLTVLLGILIFTDITRSNKYRKELILAKEEADYHSEAKQRFLANMSHEIRTPLQSIIGFSEMVRNQDEPEKEQLEIIHKSSEHLLQLVNEILDYSRIVSNSFEYASESFEIGRVVEEVIGSLKPQADAKGVDLKFENRFSPDSFLVGDTFRIKQILNNLIGNAVKFTREGYVKIIAEPIESAYDRQIQLKVCDTGIGMQPGEIERIFNQFEQGHTGITPEFGGSGLGLSIVRELVKGLGGEISVKSTFGKGSEFTVTLPLIEGTPASEEITLSNLTDAETVFEGKVWIIDDDKFILQWLKQILEQSGLKVQPFSSPIDADNHPWDPEVKVVFCDIRMPEMSGTELCRRLKKKSDNTLKVVACTAMALPDEKAEILRQGFDYLMMKPFKKDDVLRALGLLVEKIATTGQIQENGNVQRTDKNGETPNNKTVELDISNLIAMTMGDEQLLKDSLGQFVEDTICDLQLVEHQMGESDNRSLLQNLFHRLAGRTGQVGAGALGQRMRSIELALADAKPVSEEEIEEVVQSGYDLVDVIQEKFVS